MRPAIIICTYDFEDVNRINSLINNCVPKLDIKWNNHDILSSNFKEYITILSKIRKFINFGILCDEDGDYENVSSELLDKFMGKLNREPFILKFVHELKIIHKFSMLIYDDWDELTFEEEFINYDFLYERFNTPYCGMHTCVYMDNGIYSAVLTNPIFINVGFNERYGLLSYPTAPDAADL